MAEKAKQGETPIGGYFELDLPRRGFLHDDAVLLNSGRACLEAVLTARRPRHVYVPRYTCDVVIEPMAKLGISHSLYAVDATLGAPDLPDPGADELLVVNNYFGLQDHHCDRLSRRFGDRLVVDCSQAWYAPPPAASHCFYSPRKFFGLPDGGCLYSPDLDESDLADDRSGDRMSHLVKRLELGPQAGFADFRRNDASLSSAPMRRMSRLTRQLLGLADHEGARLARRRNFAALDTALKGSNRFDWGNELPGSGAPMVYPYWPEQGSSDMRTRLQERQIFVATYWPNVFGWTSPEDIEHRLAAEMLPLPIDQRYGPADMARIVETLTEIV